MLDQPDAYLVRDGKVLGTASAARFTCHLVQREFKHRNLLASPGAGAPRPTGCISAGEDRKLAYYAAPARTPERFLERDQSEYICLAWYLRHSAGNVAV